MNSGRPSTTMDHPCNPLTGRTLPWMTTAFTMVDNAPAKTQTFRVWGSRRAREHKESFTEGKWIRVWRGQGHKDTIGWLLITHWDEIKVGDIDKGDCVRECRPEWEPADNTFVVWTMLPQ